MKAFAIKIPCETHLSSVGTAHKPNAPAGLSVRIYDGFCASRHEGPATQQLPCLRRGSRIWQD
jgi:hypothetical protein